MKIKLIALALMIFLFGTVYADNRDNPAVQALDQTVAIERTSQTKLLMASTCPTGCTSCWDQCTTSSDCGTGHKCISTTCGNRCTKK